MLPFVYLMEHSLVPRISDQALNIAHFAGIARNFMMYSKIWNFRNSQKKLYLIPKITKFNLQVIHLSFQTNFTLLKPFLKSKMRSDFLDTTIQKFRHAMAYHTEVIGKVCQVSVISSWLMIVISYMRTFMRFFDLWNLESAWKSYLKFRCVFCLIRPCRQFQTT